MADCRGVYTDIACRLSMSRPETAPSLYLSVRLPLHFYYASAIVRTLPEAFCFGCISLCVQPWSYYKFVNKMSYKSLVGISPNLQLRYTWGPRGEMIRFRGPKVKGQGRSKTTYGQIRAWGGIFASVSKMRGRILMTLITVTHYQVHMTLMTFSRSWV